MRTTLLARILAACLALTATTVGAQEPRAFADLGLDLNLGDLVRVVDLQGVRHDGTVRSLPPGTLVITGADGPRSFTADTTAAVQRRGDPVWTGALTGFIAGFFLGTQFVAGFSDHDEAVTTYAVAGGIVGAGGAGLGALIDSLHEGRRTIYSAAPPAAVAVSPLVGRGRLGAAASVRW